MSESMTIEAGHYGRLLLARVKPNRDLIESLEALCTEHRIARAVIRSALGSLVDGHLVAPNGQPDQKVVGPGVEILSVTGEITTDESGSLSTVLTGVIAGTDGKMHAGTFLRGANLAFITMEISLQEWIPEEAVEH